QFKVDLALELDALPRLNKGIEVCREIDDNGTRLLLEEILHEEEEHVDWLEAQIAQVKQMGIQNYLAQQVREEE
ncbi:MAG: ferritin-like domain-containing protein, partial [Thermoanaerobaculia bacterium]